jgi:hypothetical protein
MVAEGEAVNRNGMTSLEVTLGAEGQFLESPLQGNLHGGFGGGVRKHSSAVRLAPTLHESRMHGANGGNGER